MRPMNEEDNLPRLVWTFPLVRRVQNRQGLFALLNMSSSFSSSAEEEDGADAGYSRDSQSNDKIKENLDELDSNSDIVFNQADGSSTVEMEEDTFIPVRTMISVDDTVEWVNNDDKRHRVLSTTGEEFASEDIEPGETFGHTFEEEGVTKYIDSTLGADVMCGAIIVGDAQMESELPCEASPDRVLSDDKEEVEGVEDISSLTTRTMSSAAEEKEEMDTGFN